MWRIFVFVVLYVQHVYTQLVPNESIEELEYCYSNICKSLFGVNTLGLKEDHPQFDIQGVATISTIAEGDYHYIDISQHTIAWVFINTTDLQIISSHTGSGYMTLTGDVVYGYCMYDYVNTTTSEYRHIGRCGPQVCRVHSMLTAQPLYYIKYQELHRNQLLHIEYPYNIVRQPDGPCVMYGSNVDMYIYQDGISRCVEQEYSQVLSCGPLPPPPLHDDLLKDITVCMSDVCKSLFHIGNTRGDSIEPSNIVAESRHLYLAPGARFSVGDRTDGVGYVVVNETEAEIIPATGGQLTLNGYVSIGMCLRRSGYGQLWQNTTKCGTPICHVHSLLLHIPLSYESYEVYSEDSVYDTGHGWGIIRHASGPCLNFHHFSDSNQSITPQYDTCIGTHTEVLKCKL